MQHFGLAFGCFWGKNNSIQVCLFVLALQTQTVQRIGPLISENP